MPEIQDGRTNRRIIRFGPFSADLNAGMLLKHGIRIHLQELPFHILALLLSRPGMVITRQELHARFWPDASPVDGENSLNAAVNRLRRALNDLAEHPRYIETLPKRGYRYVGPAVEGMLPEGEPGLSLVRQSGSGAHAKGVLSFGEFHLDIETGELLRNGVLVHLPHQPSQVLALLGRRQGRLVTREELRREIWGNDTFVDFEQGLNHCINQIRTALGDEAGQSRFIQTLPRRGYRFAAPVESVPGGAETAGPPAAPQPKAAGLRWWWILSVLLLVLVGVAALFTSDEGGLRNILAIGVSSPRIGSIAVLPLENLSGNPDQEYFADGMTEELVTALGKIGSFRVISRTSVMRYKRTQKPIPQIARELNVDAVIEGTVTQAGGRARITTNLLHGPTDRHLWAESYERDLGDVIAMQRDVARDVARQVRSSVSMEQPARFAPARRLNPEAYELYLKGQFHYYRWSAPEFAKAISYFERAAAVDPNYAQAYLGLAKTYGWQWMKGVLPPEIAYRKFSAALKRALEIDNALPEGHYVQAVSAWFFYWNWAQAESAFQRALALNPNFEEARFEYAWFLASMGRHDEAVAHARRAVEGDPLSYEANIALGSVYQFARRFDEALVQCGKTIALEPNNPLGYEFLAAAYNKLGLYDEAVRAFLQEMALSGVGREVIVGADDAYRAGGREGYLRWRLVRAKHPYQMAAFQAQLGMKDDAFRNLERCYREHWWAMVQLYQDPKWDPLRPDPRFQDLLRRMNFPR